MLRGVHALAPPLGWHWPGRECWPATKGALGAQVALHLYGVAEDPAKITVWTVVAGSGTAPDPGSVDNRNLDRVVANQCADVLDGSHPQRTAARLPGGRTGRGGIALFELLTWRAR